MKEIKWDFVDKNIDEDQIECVEKILCITFPDDYRECAKCNSGGSPPFTSMDERESQIPGIESLLSFNPKDDLYILSKYYLLNYHSYTVHTLPDGIVPFTLSYNDYLCFDYRNGFPPKIVLWDHYAEKDEEGISFVSNSFSELLEILYGDQ